MTTAAPDFSPAWSKNGRGGPAFPSGHPGLGPLWQFLWDRLADEREPVSQVVLLKAVIAGHRVFRKETVYDLLWSAWQHGYLWRRSQEVAGGRDGKSRYLSYCYMRNDHGDFAPPVEIVDTDGRRTWSDGYTATAD